MFHKLKKKIRCVRKNSICDVSKVNVVEEITIEKEKASWTDWKNCFFILGFEYSNYVYKTNGFKTIVKQIDTKTKTRVSCHPNDEFDIKFAIKLATIRINKKQTRMSISKLETELDILKSHLKDCEEHELDLIKSHESLEG